MRLSKLELAALCECIDERRASGASWGQIEEELAGYTVPERAGVEPRMSEEDMGRLPELHRRWARQQEFVARQRASGDARAVSRGVAEVLLTEAAGVAEALPETVASVGPEALALASRVEALRVVRYLSDRLLQARWEWVLYRKISLKAGEVCEVREGVGRVDLGDGTEVSWMLGAVVICRGTLVRAVYPECSLRGLRPVERGRRSPRAEIWRRELVGKEIDMRGLSASLAVLLHICLGGEHSPFRNNEHLAELLGVSREAIRMRKKSTMARTGIRSAEGLVPARAKGGKRTQELKKKNPEAA